LATKQISDFPITTTIDPVDVFHLQSGGVDKQIAAEDLLTITSGGGSVVVNTFLAGADFSVGVSNSLNVTQTLLSKKNAWIFFDGVYQEKDQYEVSGALITFDEVIPEGVSVIEIVMPVVININSTSSDNVSFNTTNAELLLSQNIVFNNVAAMSAATFLSVGMKCRTLGYYTPGDGGANNYEIVAAATGTDDGGSYIDLATHQAKGLFVSGEVSVKQFGAILDGVEDDISPLMLSVALGKKVLVPGPFYGEPSVSEVPALLNNINSLWFSSPSEIQLPDSNGSDVVMTQRVEIYNPTAMNLTIKGVDTSSATATSVSNTGGAAKAHTVEYTLDDANNVDIGDYVLIRGATGTGDYRVVEGCFPVTDKSGDVITITHSLNNSWPTLTLTSATVWPLKTILRWPANTIGISIVGTGLRALRNLVLAGSFDISVDTPSDGPDDGLQVGAAPNTSVTSLNESEQQNSGSVWCSRIGIVEFENNGVQINGGNAYFTTAAACGNGWRGFQAARNGSCVCKFTSAIGNGASGYEAESGGAITCNNSVSAGNWQQGYYGIGGCSVTASETFAIANVTNGYDARNGAVIVADGGTASSNTVNGVNCIASTVIFGSGAISAGNGDDDISSTEGGLVDGNGASSLGSSINIDDSGALVVDAGGERIRLNSINLLENSDGDQFSLLMTSIGDVHFRSNIGSGDDVLWTLKTGGILHPNEDGTQDLGRSSNRVRYLYASSFRAGDGSVQWTSGDGSPEGTLSAEVGSLYTDVSGSTGTTLYVKESGSGNTGWVSK
jgi:hypothetical protein